MLRNPFFDQLMEAYQKGTNTDELVQLLGRGRAKKGMFEGDLTEGELEIGQIAGAFDDILPAATIVKQFIEEFNQAIKAQHPFSI